jgi:hypothetical protein
MNALHFFHCLNASEFYIDSAPKQQYTELQTNKIALELDFLLRRCKLKNRDFSFAKLKPFLFIQWNNRPRIQESPRQAFNWRAGSINSLPVPLKYLQHSIECLLAMYDSRFS